MTIIKSLGQAMSHALFGAIMVVATLIGASATASADEVTFTIRNNHPNALELQLYSQNRSHIWPGPDEVYYLDDGEAKDVPLSCRSGESICYGAWIAGDQDTYWGVGPNNANRCTDCCYVCGAGDTEEIVLTP